MTSPYYNNLSVVNQRSGEQAVTNVLNQPVPYDACDECGEKGHRGNPVIGAQFGGEVIFQCQDCSLNEIYTELDKENG